MPTTRRAASDGHAAPDRVGSKDRHARRTAEGFRRSSAAIPSETRYRSTNSSDGRNRRPRENSRCVRGRSQAPSAGGGSPAPPRNNNGGGPTENRTARA